MENTPWSYEATCAAWTGLTQRAFCVCAQRLERRGEPIHHILISGLRILGNDMGVHITLVIHRPGSETHYGFTIGPDLLNAISQEEIDQTGAKIATQRLLEDQAAYARVMSAGEDVLFYRA